MFFQKSISDQIAFFAQGLNNTYQADLVSETIQKELKKFLAFRELTIQKNELNSLNSIYRLLCPSPDAINKAAAYNVNTTVFELLSQPDKNYSLSQINTVLQAFNKTKQLTPEKAEAICIIIKNIPSIDTVRDIEKLSTKLSGLRFSRNPEKQNDRCYSALDTMLNLDADKVLIFYRLFCEVPHGTDASRMMNRLTVHFTDLCKLSQPILRGCNTILKLFLSNDIFISDELNQFNRPWLNTIMHRFIQCMMYLDQHPKCDTSIVDFESYFICLSENKLISVENLHAIFTLVEKEKGTLVAIDNIQDLMVRTRKVYDKNALNQDHFKQLIEAMQPQHQNARESFLGKEDSGYGSDNSSDRAGPSSLYQRTGYLTPPDYPPPPYSEVDPNQDTIQKSELGWRKS